MVQLFGGGKGSAHAGSDGTATPTRPSHFNAGTTQRDIHAAEVGQSTAPAGAESEPTRVCVWRPLTEKTNIAADPPPTDKEKECLAALKQYTESELVLGQEDPYAKWERRFLEKRDTYLRYVRASDARLEEAKKRMKETLAWRRDYKPDLIKPSEIAHEAEGGKVVVNGFDTAGRPIVWLRPSRENTEPSPLQIRHLIFQLERAIDLMPDGVTKLALVVDYHGATTQTNPPVDTAKQVLHILQHHYVERLGRAVVMNVPWYLNAFFSVLKPLLDPKTKEKIRFNPHLEELVPAQQLDHEFGGDLNYVYDSRVYLPALCHFCGVKEDGTREEWIPQEHPESESARPEGIQRRLTAQADQATLESDAQEAREATSSNANQGLDDASRPVNGTGIPDSSREGAAVGGAAVAGTAGAAMALHAKDEKEGRSHQGDPSRDLSHPTGNDEQNQRTDKGKGKSDQTDTGSSEDGENTQDDKSEEQKKREKAKEMSGRGKHAFASIPVRTEEVESAAAPTTTALDMAGPPREPPSSSSPSHPSAPTARANGQPQKERPISTASTNKARGGPKIFGKARGLDHEGLPTIHKHRHISRFLCMHKGAVSPSSRDATTVHGPAAPERADEASAPAQPVVEKQDVLAAEPGKNRVKIAPEAAESKPYNAPLATNATVGPDGYHTALDGADGDFDYFAEARHKAVPVNDHPDRAKVVTDQENLAERLHTGQDTPSDLTMQFQVLKPPTNGDAAQQEIGATQA